MKRRAFIGARPWFVFLSPGSLSPDSVLFLWVGFWLPKRVNLDQSLWLRPPRTKRTESSSRGAGVSLGRR